MRTRIALGLLVTALLTGCGSSRSSSPVRVVRAWSEAVNAGDDEAAAALFARGAIVVQNDRIVLQTREDAMRWNASLPCAGHITTLAAIGNEVTVTFVLGARPGRTCDGPGEQAAAIFTVEHGKIVRWEQVPAAQLPEPKAPPI